MSLLTLAILNAVLAAVAVAVLAAAMIRPHLRQRSAVSLAAAAPQEGRLSRAA